MKKCGNNECNKTMKAYGDPMLHGNFMDQLLSCSCGWTDVDTEILSDQEVKDYKKERERILRLSRPANAKPE